MYSQLSREKLLEDYNRKLLKSLEKKSSKRVNSDFQPSPNTKAYQELANSPDSEKKKRRMAQTAQNSPIRDPSYLHLKYQIFSKQKEQFLGAPLNI